MANRIKKWWRNWRTKDYVKVKKYIIDQIYHNNLRLLFEDDIPRGFGHALQIEHANGCISDVELYRIVQQMVGNKTESRVHSEIKKILDIHLGQLKLLLPLKDKRIKFPEPPKMEFPFVRSTTQRENKRKRKIFWD